MTEGLQFSFLLSPAGQITADSKKTSLTDLSDTDVLIGADDDDAQRFARMLNGLSLSQASGNRQNTAGWGLPVTSESQNSGLPTDDIPAEDLLGLIIKSEQTETHWQNKLTDISPDTAKEIEPDLTVIRAAIMAVGNTDTVLSDEPQPIAETSEASAVVPERGVIANIVATVADTAEQVEDATAKVKASTLKISDAVVSAALEKHSQVKPEAEESGTPDTIVSALAARQVSSNQPLSADIKLADSIGDEDPDKPTAGAAETSLQKQPQSSQTAGNKISSQAALVQPTLVAENSQTATVQPEQISQDAAIAQAGNLASQMTNKDMQAEPTAVTTEDSRLASAAASEKTSQNAAILQTSHHSERLQQPTAADAEQVVLKSQDSREEPADNKSSAIKNTMAEQRSTTVNVKIGAEQQPDRDSQQQSQTAAQFTAGKAQADSVSSARVEQPFSAVLQTAELRQQQLTKSGSTQTSLSEQLRQQLNLQQPEAAGQLRERMTVMLRQNIQSIDIQLAPAELGKMQIKVNMQQEQASVQFIVQQPQAKELLEQQLPRLREMLQQQGIQLTEGQVHQQQQQSQERQLAQQGQQQRKQQHDTAPDNAEELPPQININVKLSERMVDYYA